MWVSSQKLRRFGWLASREVDASTYFGTEYLPRLLDASVCPGQTMSEEANQCIPGVSWIGEHRTLSFQCDWTTLLMDGHGRNWSV